MCRWTKERTVTVSAFCFCGKRLDDVREDFCSEACERRYLEQREKIFNRYYALEQVFPMMDSLELEALTHDSLLLSRKEFQSKYSTS